MRSLCARPGRAAALLALAGLLGAGCDDATAPEGALVVTLDLRVPAPDAHIGEWVSPLEEATLIVFPEGAVQGEERTLTASLEPTDSLVTFDLSLEVGRHQLAAEIFSNNGSLLYRGSTTAVIEEDGFVIELVVRPVNPVLQVRPGEPTPIENWVDVPLTIRNGGVDTLSLTDLGADVQGQAEVWCWVPRTEASCSTGLGPRGSREVVVTVYFEVPSSSDFEIWLESEVGTVFLDVVNPR